MPDRGKCACAKYFVDAKGKTFNDAIVRSSRYTWLDNAKGIYVETSKITWVGRLSKHRHLTPWLFCVLIVLLNHWYLLVDVARGEWSSFVWIDFSFFLEGQVSHSFSSLSPKWNSRPDLNSLFKNADMELGTDGWTTRSQRLGKCWYSTTDGQFLSIHIGMSNGNAVYHNVPVAYLNAIFWRSIIEMLKTGVGSIYKV